ncbi:hypothetical protein [Amycolatopsis taiwanensis]|uniref:Uncharacterized protein n=1 Tax=Amycolatopsis taiwanensis TaxID=342230 RepID=A0A9W6QZM8_9PSEU|nr:hypothetical protein [Amycolatopsis taiwanensis]GLY66911.1 hypothetical protein Atai01_35300 [Amycolatopsis taiwanensis]
MTPAYEAAKPLPGDQIENTVRAQTCLTVRQLRRDPIVDAVRSNVIGAYCHLDTGSVDFTVAP